MFAAINLSRIDVHHVVLRGVRERMDASPFIDGRRVSLARSMASCSILSRLTAVRTDARSIVSCKLETRRSPSTTGTLALCGLC